MRAGGVLSAVIWLLVGLNALVLTVPPRPGPVIPEAGAPTDRPPRPQPPAIQRETADRVATLLARPLFTPSRRPAPPPAAAAPPALQRLTGIIVGPFGKRALFASNGAGKTLAVDEGGAVGPWTVQAITSRTVTLTGPGGRRELPVVGEGNHAAAADTAALLAETATPWTNPCGRLHRTFGYQPNSSRDERCALAAARFMQ